MGIWLHNDIISEPAGSIIYIFMNPVFERALVS